MKEGRSRIYYAPRNNTLLCSYKDAYTILEDYTNPVSKILISNDFLGSVDDKSYKPEIFKISDDGKIVHSFMFTHDSAKFFRFNLSDLSEYQEYTLKHDGEWFIPHSSRPDQLFFVSQDDEYLVIKGKFTGNGGQNKRQISFWDFSNGQFIATVDDDFESGEIYSIHHHNDTIVILTKGESGSFADDSLLFQLYDINSGKMKNISKFTPFRRGATWFTFSNGFNYLAVNLVVSNHECSMILYNMHSNEFNTIPETSYDLFNFEFSPDSKYLAFIRDKIDYPDEIIIYDVKDESIHRTITSSSFQANSVKFSKDGKRIIVEEYYNAVSYLNPKYEIYDYETGELLFSQVKRVPGISNYEFSADGSKICTLADNETVSVFSTKDGRLLNKFDKGLAFPRDPSISFSADNNNLLISDKGDFYFTYYGLEANNYQIHNVYLDELVYFDFSTVSPDGKSLVCVKDKKIIFQDIATEEILYILEDYDKTIRKIEFSKNSEKIIAVTFSGFPDFITEYMEWDFQANKTETHIIDAEIDIETKVDFSRSQKFICIGDYWIWDIQNKKKIYDATFQPEFEDFFDISSDGKYLAFLNKDGSWSNTLKIKDLQKDSIVHQFSFDSNIEIIGDDGNMNFGKAVDVKFSPNDSSIATLFEDGTLIMWKIPDDLLVGVEEEEYTPQTEAMIYPNPAGDYIEINFGNGASSLVRTDIRIYNMLGGCVMKEFIHPTTSSYKMNVSELPAGVYFLRLPGEAFSGEAFSGEAFSGEAFSSEAFSSGAFSGGAKMFVKE